MSFTPKFTEHELESRVLIQRGEREVLARELLSAYREITRLSSVLNTPEILDFSRAVELEAAHQRERWGTEHDGGKAPSDWFWLLGYLGGKALRSAEHGDVIKALHHTISSAAALANWHVALLGAHTAMRPGISEEKQRATDGGE